VDTKVRYGWLWGAAAGAAAGAATLWMARSRQPRSELVLRAGAVTQRALERIGTPAESRFFRVGDLRLHGVVAGPENGPLVVLLHGFPDCWYGWLHQIPVLAEAGYRVVALDQRGYNLSDKPEGVRQYSTDLLTGDVLGVIHSLGRGSAVIAGHDWGGIVAWRMAMDHPAAVDKLIILNAPHPKAFARELRRGWNQRRRSWYMLFFRVPWVPETLFTLSPSATARFVFRGTALRRDTFSDSDLEVLAAALAQPGAMRCMLNWYRASFRFSLSRRTQTIDTRTLLLWGEDDPFLSQALTYGLEKWVPNVDIHYIPQCGHWVQNEAAGEVNEWLAAFLAGAA
jgi:pimeloyl-ACP methyl ester carboxylesterase